MGKLPRLSIRSLSQAPNLSLSLSRQQKDGGDYPHPDEKPCQRRKHRQDSEPAWQTRGAQAEQESNDQEWHTHPCEKYGVDYETLSAIRKAESRERYTMDHR